MLCYNRSLNTAGGNCWSHCPRRGSLGRVSKLCASNDSAFTKSLCLPKKLKSTFNYDAISDAAGKVDFLRAVIFRGKTDGKWLLRLEWHEKLYRSYTRELTTLPPLTQCCEYFIEDHNPRYESCIWKMSRQARMVSTNRAGNFNGHSRTLRPPLDQATD